MRWKDVPMMTTRRQAASQRVFDATAVMIVQLGAAIAVANLAVGNLNAVPVGGLVALIGWWSRHVGRASDHIASLGRPEVHK